MQLSKDYADIANPKSKSKSQSRRSEFISSSWKQQTPLPKKGSSFTRIEMKKRGQYAMQSIAEGKEKKKKKKKNEKKKKVRVLLSIHPRSLHTSTLFLVVSTSSYSLEVKTAKDEEY